MNLKSNKGVTLIALTVTIIILLIITGAIISNVQDQINIQKLDQLNVDIELLNANVDDYYLTYGELPILCDYLHKEAFVDEIYKFADTRHATLNNDPNPNDGDNYAVIDVEKLGGITLHYGYEKGGTTGDYNLLKTNRKISEDPNHVEDEIYVINTTTHQIYFPHGIVVDNIMYYTF